MDDEAKTRSQLVEDLRVMRTRLRSAESEIAACRLLESRLQEEMEFNHLLINASPAFFVAVDSTDKMLLANRAFLERTGYGMDEIGGVDFLETFISKGEREDLSRVMKHVVAEGVSAVTQNRVLAKDGSVFIVEWHGRPVSRSNGKALIYVAMGIDITERQQMEEELAEARDQLELKVEQRTAELLILNEQLEQQIHERQSAEMKLRSSEERYRQLTEYSLTGIYIHQNQRFVFVNNRLASMLGYTPNEMVGESIWKFVNPDDRQTILDTEAERKRGQNADEPYEFRVRCKDGNTKWVVALASEIVFEGASAHMGNVADITERKRIEQELREKIDTIDDLYQHIVQSRQAKAIAEHTANVAHELRQPLAIIGGFARRLKAVCKPCEKCDEKLESRGEESFQIVINEVSRLEKILGGLIEFTRRERLEMHETDPNSLIEYVVLINSMRLEEKNLILDTNLAPTGETLMLDRARFQQVVRNLLSNAIEASPLGGKIHVASRVSEPSDEARRVGNLDARRYFTLTLRNEGTPIPEDELERIFNPFFTTKDYGTGLGLSLSRKIVENHRGSISVASDEGGTVFTVMLPMSASGISVGREVKGENLY